MKTGSIRISCLSALTIALVFLLCSDLIAKADSVISTREDFIQAIEIRAESGQTEYQLTLSSALLSDIKTGMNDWVSEARDNCGIRSFTYSFNERAGTMRLTNIEYRTAVRILQAAKNGDASSLTGAESLTLNKAYEIIRNAPTDLAERERYLHDTLCSIVEYYTDDIAYSEKDQAVGALLNGRADCDGYSEAFYLLCNLAGIPARFQHGDTFKKGDRSDAAHMWNLVNIYGLWLMVDVTWDDLDMAAGNVYLYYNIGSKRAAETHIWRSDAVTVEWAEKAGNFTRTADTAEGYAPDPASAEAYIVEKLSNRNTSRAALSFAQDMDLERDKDIVSSWIYSTGVRDYYWKFGGHSLEILVTDRYKEYRIVSNDAEALEYIDEMKRSGKSEFSIFFSGEYGKKLFAGDMAAYYLLEGQFGFAEDDMLYSSKSFRASYSNVRFADHFRVCRTEQEIIDYIMSCAQASLHGFSFSIPNDYGSSLFKNRLEQLNSVLRKTLLTNDRDLTYYEKSQLLFIKNANYWPDMNRVNLRSLDASVRHLLSSNPGSIAFWNDGTFQWNDSSYKLLSSALHRSGVDTFRYIISPERIDILDIRYYNNYCLVSSEDDIMNYLRACRARFQYSFRLYCTEELYTRLSSNRFTRFFELTSSVLKSGQSISYIDDYYMISMDAVDYK